MNRNIMYFIVVDVAKFEANNINNCISSQIVISNHINVLCTVIILVINQDYLLKLLKRY